MAFDIMRIMIPSMTLSLPKQDGEALLNILQKAVAHEHAGSRQVAHSHESLSVSLVRFEDLNDEEAKLYKKLQTQPPLFSRLGITSAGPRDDIIEEP